MSVLGCHAHARRGHVSPRKTRHGHGKRGHGTRYAYGGYARIAHGTQGPTFLLPPSSLSSPPLRRLPRNATIGSGCRWTGRKQTHSTQEDDAVKLIIAIIQPHRLEAVKAALGRRRGVPTDRHGRAGLRPPAGPHRGLPRPRIRRQPLAEGATDDRRERGIPRADHRRDHSRRTERGRGRDRRRQDLRPPPGRLHPHPHRRTRRRSDLRKGLGIRD